MSEDKRPSTMGEDDEEGVHPDLICNNCGHESPHLQQDWDECWCGCVEYDCPRYPAGKGSS